MRDGERERRDGEVDERGREELGEKGGGGRRDGEVD
jgi:hypothetical protein